MQDEQHECSEAAKSRHLVNAVHWPGIIQQSSKNHCQTFHILCAIRQHCQPNSSIKSEPHAQRLSLYNKRKPKI